MYNCMVDVFWFFKRSSRPLCSEEFVEFWMSMTEDERQYYREVELPV